MNFGRRLPATALVTALVGVLGLSACTNSTPSKERMANDIIETVDGLTDDERDCMRERLDEYSGSELDAINDENQNVDWEAEGATGGEKWQALVDDLAECRTGGAAADGSEPGDSSTSGTEPDGTTTDETASDESEPASDDTVAADETDAADETEPAATTEPGGR